MAAGAIEAGDIILDEGDEGTEEHGSVREPWRVDPNNGSQLGGEEQEVEGADDGDAASQPGFVKQPEGDRIRLAVHADETPSANVTSSAFVQSKAAAVQTRSVVSNGVMGCFNFGFWILNLGLTARCA